MQINLRNKHGQKGATGSGYALTVGLISIVALGAVTGTGNSVIELFGGVGDTLIEVAEANLSITPDAASSMDITAGPVPAYSASQNFLVKNIGNSPTAALSVSLTNSTDFVIDSDGCTGLKLGSLASCAVAVSAIRVENGSYAGELRVGGGAKFVTANLSGTASGLAPAALSVDQPTVTGMNVAGPGSPATGTPVTLTFTNDGDIATGTLTTSNDNATNFAISADSCNGNTLTGGATCSLTVTPQASTGSGTVTASVSISDGSVSAASSLSGDLTGFAAYGFTSHTFTSCGYTGRSGPNVGDCRSAYSTTWDENPSNFDVSSGIQLWTVPETANYRITAVGASSLSIFSGYGYGAQMQGVFSLTEGQQIKILVGQRGTGSSYQGGGGGSFVTTSSNSPLIVAGGGAGWDTRYSGNASPNQSATTSTTGNTGSYCAGTAYAGGSSGNGGGGSTGGGGGGLTGNGGSPGGASFTNGGLGGAGSQGSGGFGGGGGTDDDQGSGGGGYSGGGGCSENGNGGGGGSYNGGSSQSNSISTHNGEGYVTIEKL